MASNQSSTDADEAVDNYLRRVRARQSKHTLKNRRIAAEQFREFCERQGISLFDAGELDIEDWIDHMLDDAENGGEGFAPRTTRNKVYDVSAMMQYFERRDLVDENPVEDVDLSDYSGTVIDEYSEVRYLEKEEYESMVEAAERTRDKLLIQLLWNTGVRAEEAVGIEYENHIDRDEREIQIRTGKQSSTSSDGPRKVYYNRQMERTMREWLDRGGRDRYLSADDSDYLLVTKQAEQMTPNRVTELVDEVAREADVQEELWTDASGRPRRRVTAHAFRHSYAVHRVKAGMPIVYLQDLMGHADIEQTRTYLKFRDDDLREAERYYSKRI